MFGDPVDNEKRYPVHQLSEIATSRLGKMLDKKKQTGLYQRKYLANVNVQWFRFELSDLNMMDFNEDDQKEFSLKNGDPHKFRRTLATMAIDKGMPIEQVQQLLGHESVDTTLQYAMVNQANVKQAHHKYIG